jgi:flagellar motor switch protein FliG
VTEAAFGGPADLTDVEKSAMVMMLVGQETAAEVVKFLSQPEINRLSMAMRQISAVPKNTAATVLREFVDLMHGTTRSALAAAVRDILGESSKEHSARKRPISYWDD